MSMRTLSRFALAVVCLLIAASTARAQNDRDRYTVPFTVTNITAARSITIVSGGKQLELEQITIQPTGGSGVTVQLERDCTVSAGSPLQRAAINAETSPAGRPLFNVYDNTTSTSCSILSPAWFVPDGALLGIPMAKTYIAALGKSVNIRIGTISGFLSGTLRGQITLTEAR